MLQGSVIAHRPPTETRDRGTCRQLMPRPGPCTSIVGRLFDEPEVEADQKQDKVNHGPQAADFRRLHNVCAQDRHRNLSKIEIEQYAGVHEERTGQELAKVPTPPSQVQGPNSQDNPCDDIENDDHRQFLHPDCAERSRGDTGHGHQPNLGVVLSTRPRPPEPKDDQNTVGRYPHGHGKTGRNSRLRRVANDTYELQLRPVLPACASVYWCRKWRSPALALAPGKCGREQLWRTHLARSGGCTSAARRSTASLDARPHRQGRAARGAPGLLGAVRGGGRRCGVRLEFNRQHATPSISPAKRPDGSQLRQDPDTPAG